MRRKCNWSSLVLCLFLALVSESNVIAAEVEYAVPEEVAVVAEDAEEPEETMPEETDEDAEEVLTEEIDEDAEEVLSDEVGEDTEFTEEAGENTEEVLSEETSENTEEALLEDKADVEGGAESAVTEEEPEQADALLTDTTWQEDFNYEIDYSLMRLNLGSYKLIENVTEI